MRRVMGQRPLCFGIGLARRQTPIKHFHAAFTEVRVVTLLLAAAETSDRHGIENEKVDPGPSFSDAHMRPWWLSTMERLTESPIPIPSFFVV